MCFLQPDGFKNKTILFGDKGRIKPTKRECLMPANKFGAAMNATTGKTFILVGDRPNLQLESWGEEGGHINYQRKCFVGNRGVSEVVSYLTLADNEEESLNYIALKV